MPIPLDFLADSELDKLNKLLPWACYTVDSRGRRVGRPFSEQKRNDPQEIPDFRIVDLNNRVSLEGKDVLEMGCFEGVHTAALCQFGAKVTAVDGRIEHIVKTQARCALYGFYPQVACLDLEGETAVHLLSCDVLIHIGVLYHLSDPVTHLRSLLPHVKDAIFLDTHVARPGEVTHRYESCGQSFLVRLYVEGGRSEPFSGLRDHAKWMLKDDLMNLLREEGFVNLQELGSEDQRNGLRVRLLGRKAN
jgi:hypothetical protein